MFAVLAIWIVNRVGLETTIINLVKVLTVADKKLELGTKVVCKLQNTVGILPILVLLHWFFHLSTYLLLD